MSGDIAKYVEMLAVYFKIPGYVFCQKTP